MANETADAAKQLHDELLPNMPDGSHDSSGCPFCSPASTETASEGAPMAGENTATAAVDLNDPSIVAVVTDRVARETAELRTRAETAEKQRDELQTKLDVAEAEKAAAITAKETAEAAQKVAEEAAANEKAAADRKETRKVALREVAAHLSDEWFGSEVKVGETAMTRLDLIAKKTDEEFDAYKAEIAAAFEGVTVAPAATTGGSTAAAATSQGGVPRETAMAGAATGGGKAASPSSTLIGRVNAYGRR